MAGIDFKEFGLDGAPIYSDAVMNAMSLLRGMGYQIVPTSRFRAVDVGGVVQTPPVDASEMDCAAHYVSIFRDISRAFGAQCVSDRVIERRVNALPERPGFEYLGVRALLVIPERELIENTTAGPKKIGPFLDQGKPGGKAKTSPAKRQ